MEIKIISEHDNIRLADELKNHLSRRMYRSLKAFDIIIYVNKKPQKLYELVRKNDIITFDYEIESKNTWDLYESDIEVLYEDSNYLVVNKRRNLLTIPKKTDPHSLYQEALYYLNQKGENPQISILNRLDYETSGLVLVAKNKLAASRLSPTHEHIIRKYEALLDGVLESDNGLIKTYIDKDTNSNKRFVSESGKLAITNYKVLKRYSDKTLVEFILDTGRTHQIRVHSLYLGHPIIGDKLYGTLNGSDLHLTSVYLKFKNMDDKIIELKIDNWWNNEF